MSYSWKDIVDIFGFNKIKEIHRSIINSISSETKNIYDKIVIAKYQDDKDQLLNLQNNFELDIAKARFFKTFVDQYEKDAGI